MLKDLNNVRTRQKPDDDKRIGLDVDFIVTDEYANTTNANTGMNKDKKLNYYDSRNGMSETKENLPGGGVYKENMNQSEGEFNEEIVYEKYTVYWHNKKDDKIHNVIIELPQSATVLDAIIELIPIFQAKLTKESNSIIFDINTNAYKLYPAKKNGFPKSDYPALDVEQCISMTALQSLALVELDLKNSKQPKTIPTPPSNSKVQSFINNKSQIDQSNLQNSTKTMASMTEPNMPHGTNRDVSHNFSTKGDTEIEQTWCCFRKKVKQSTRKSSDTLSSSIQSDLEKQLIN